MTIMRKNFQTDLSSIKTFVNGSRKTEQKWQHLEKYTWIICFHRRQTLAEEENTKQSVFIKRRDKEH